MFDVQKARLDTPYCQKIIYFNNAGASLMPTVVSKAVFQYLKKEQYIGGYEIQEEHQNSLLTIYQSAANLLNCNNDEIAYVESATRAWQFAFYSLPLKKGDKVLTSVTEYGSNLVGLLHRCKKNGIDLIFIDNDEFGQVDINQLSNAIDNNVKLIAMTHMPTGSGLINPILKIGQIAKSANIPFLLDTCQSVGQSVVDVQKIACDALCITGRKYLRAPRGTGLLYIKKSLFKQLEPPILDQNDIVDLSKTHYQSKKTMAQFESHERSYANQLGLKTAIDYALSWGLVNIEKRIKELSHYLRCQLADLSKIQLNDDGIFKSGIVTFTINDIEANIVKEHLRKHHIFVAIVEGMGSLLSFKQRGLKKVIRASLHYYNTKAEIDYFIVILKQLIKTN